METRIVGWRGRVPKSTAKVTENHKKINAGWSYESYSGKTAVNNREKHRGNILSKKSQ